MRQKEMREAILVKNSLLVSQSKRIELLEKKMTELRKRFFELKYEGITLDLKGRA